MEEVRLNASAPVPCIRRPSWAFNLVIWHMERLERGRFFPTLLLQCMTLLMGCTERDACKATC